MELKQPVRAYTFGNLLLDLREGLLLCEGEPVPLTPKAFETLVMLVENSGHVLSKDELMRKVWPDSFVEENNLSQNISQLRRALQCAGEEASRYIETVPRRGYRFKAQVTAREEDASETVVLRERTRTRILIEEDDDQNPLADEKQTAQATHTVAREKSIDEGRGTAGDEFAP